MRPPSYETVIRWRYLLLGLILPAIGAGLIVWMVITKTATKEAVGSAGLLILCFVAKTPPGGGGSSPEAAPPSGTSPPAASG